MLNNDDKFHRLMKFVIIILCPNKYYAEREGYFEKYTPIRMGTIFA